MNIDYNLILTLVSLGVALATIIILIVQVKQTHFALGVDLLMKLDNEFNSERMVIIRKNIAKEFLENPKDVYYAEIISFFEKIGMLVKNGALDKKMVWNSFYTWISIYYHVNYDDINEMREDDGTAWSEFLYLYKEMSIIEMKCNNKKAKDLQPTEDDIKEFFVLENELVGC
jgi:hypothetical protein